MVQECYLNNTTFFRFFVRACICIVKMFIGYFWGRTRQIFKG